MSAKPFSIVDRERRTETSALFITTLYDSWPESELIKAANMLALVHYDSYYRIMKLSEDFCHLAGESIDLTFKAYNNLILGYLFPVQKDLQSVDAEGQKNMAIDDRINTIANELADLSDSKSASHHLVDKIVPRVAEAHWLRRMNTARRWRNRAFQIWRNSKEDYEQTPDKPEALHRYGRASLIYCKTDRNFRKKAADMTFMIGSGNPEISRDAAKVMVDLINPFLAASAWARQGRRAFDASRTVQSATPSP